MGIISAIGNSVVENYTALIEGRKGISRVSKIATVHKDQIMVGEIDFSNIEMEAQLALDPDNNYSRTALLGAIAAKQAVADAKITDIKKVQNWSHLCHECWRDGHDRKVLLRIFGR